MANIINNTVSADTIAAIEAGLRKFGVHTHAGNVNGLEVREDLADRSSEVFPAGTVALSCEYDQGFYDAEALADKLDAAELTGDAEEDYELFWRSAAECVVQPLEDEDGDDD